MGKGNRNKFTTNEEEIYGKGGFWLEWQKFPIKYKLKKKNMYEQTAKKKKVTEEKIIYLINFSMEPYDNLK